MGIFLTKPHGFASEGLY